MKDVQVPLQLIVKDLMVIDCKRPYGNSSVASDIMDILGWGKPEYGSDMWNEMRDEALDLHRETLTALQILISNFTTGAKPGVYIYNKEEESWTRKKS